MHWFLYVCFLLSKYTHTHTHKQGWEFCIKSSFLLQFATKPHLRRILLQIYFKLYLNMCAKKTLALQIWMKISLVQNIALNLTLDSSLYTLNLIVFSLYFICILLYIFRDNLSVTAQTLSKKFLFAAKKVSIRTNIYLW